MAKINKVLKHTVQKEPADWYLGMKFTQEIGRDGLLNSVVITQRPYMEQICKSNGVDINSGDAIDTYSAFVWEPALVKYNAINAANVDEAAIQRHFLSLSILSQKQ